MTPATSDAGRSALLLVRDVMGRAPTGFGHALCALDLDLGPSHEVAVVGGLDDPRTTSLATEVTRRFRPNVVLAVADPLDVRSAERVPLLAGRGLVDGSPRRLRLRALHVPASGRRCRSARSPARGLSAPGPRPVARATRSD